MQRVRAAQWSATLQRQREHPYADLAPTVNRFDLGKHPDQVELLVAVRRLCDCCGMGRKGDDRQDAEPTDTQIQLRWCNHAMPYGESESERASDQHTHDKGGADTSADTYAVHIDVPFPTMATLLVLKH